MLASFKRVVMIGAAGATKFEINTGVTSENIHFSSRKLENVGGDNNCGRPCTLYTAGTVLKLTFLKALMHEFWTWHSTIRKDQRLTGALVREVTVSIIIYPVFVLKLSAM